MNKQELPPDFFFDQRPSEGFAIDFKRVLNRAVRFWYLIVLSVLIALSVAYLRNRYATRIYPVTASIIIKEAQDISEGKLIYNNPLMSYHRNYLNELYIIKSYPIIQGVVEDLNFSVAFYREGNFLVTEAYDYIPVEAIVLNDGHSGGKKFIFTVQSAEEYTLGAADDDADLKEQRFAFGDTVAYGGLELLVNKRLPKTLLSYKGVPFILAYTPPRYLANSYVGSLNASWAEEGSGVINLDINGPDPNKNRDFLAGLIAHYQAYDLEKKTQTASRTVKFISGQLEGIRDSLQHVERQLERFKDDNVVTDLSAEALRLYQKLEALETQKTELIIRGNYYKYLTDYIRQTENLDQVILPTSVGIADPILTSLVSMMVEKQLELKMIGKANNPLVVEARRQINEIKQDIVESVENQKSTDQIKLNYLAKQISDAEKQLGYLPLAERKLVSIQRNYTLLENLYIFLLQKRSEAAISEASATSDIVLVNPPMQAGGAIVPKTGRNYAIALIISLVVPFGLFILLEIVNNKIQSKEDIEKITKAPFIGGVGHKTSEDNKVVLKNPKSMVAESFRSLRANLNYFTGGKQKGLFLVTSSISGEGKTFTTVNLATVFALSGKRTLIVGADLRRPKIFDDFNLENTTGLSTFLAGMHSYDAIVQKTSYENLDLISGGPVPPNPSELMLTTKMDELIERVKAAYDYVIIDTPPLSIVTDAFVLAKYVDHTVFVVRQNYTPKELLKTMDEFYQSGRLNKLSILLNDIHKSGPGYGYGYRYGYGYGYGYGYRESKSAHGYYTD